MVLPNGWWQSPSHLRKVQRVSQERIESDWRRRERHDAIVLWSLTGAALLIAVTSFFLVAHLVLSYHR